MTKNTETDVDEQQTDELVSAENVNNASKTPPEDLSEEELSGEKLSVEKPGDARLQNSLAELLNDCSAEELAGRVLAAEAEIAEMKEGYVRACAEVENIKRRSQNEIVSARKFAIEGFAQELLTVLDSLDQASKVEIADSHGVEGAGEAVVKMREGIELIMKQFEKVLDKFGVSVVEAGRGVKFDPQMHQAISMLPETGVESGQIVSAMQKGYMLKDRLLRPAMVVIAQ